MSKLTAEPPNTETENNGLTDPPEISQVTITTENGNTTAVKILRQFSSFHLHNPFEHQTAELSGTTETSESQDIHHPDTDSVIFDHALIPATDKILRFSRSKSSYSLGSAGTENGKRARLQRLATRLPISWPGRDEVPKIFKYIDFDNDGTLSWTELSNGLELLGFDNLPKTQKQIDAVMKQCGADTAGNINEEAFVEIFMKYNQKSLLAELVNGLEAEQKIEQQSDGDDGCRKV